MFPSLPFIFLVHHLFLKPHRHRHQKTIVDGHHRPWRYAIYSFSISYSVFSFSIWYRFWFTISLTIPLLVILFQFHFYFGLSFQCGFQLLICFNYRFKIVSCTMVLWMGEPSLKVSAVSFIVSLLIYFVLTVNSQIFCVFLYSC